MLDQFRQTAQFFGRTLLGMLLFVWLSMAIVPCVMANAVQLSEAEMDSAALHAKMENCAYCPNENSPMNHSMDNQALCQNVHINFSENIAVIFDSIDVASFVLFEIPAALPITLRRTNNHPHSFQSPPDSYRLSPLEVTGILRI